jgi:hypothetical protein
MLDGDLAKRAIGFGKEPFKSEMLDLFDTLEAEGLGQTVDNLFSELGRSGHVSGFLLEVTTAEDLLAVPKPRRLRCEQQEGLAKVPGDLWMDFEGRRYEFQCKNSMNWTAELWIDEAVDGIVAATKNLAPGRYLQIIPTTLGSQSDWDKFRTALVQSYRDLAPDEEHEFYVEGKLITQFSLLSASGLGVRWGSRVGPGGVMFMDVQHLRKKICAGLREGRRSFSAAASLNQINCLVVTFANPIVNVDDIFSALYLPLPFPNDSDDDGEVGIWSTGKHDLYSGVMFKKRYGSDSGKNFVFPNPKQANSVRAAFSNAPNFIVVNSQDDVIWA